MAASGLRLGPPVSTLELFVQAAKLLQSQPEGLDRFEKYALLDALRDRCSRDATIPETLLIYESLASTFLVDTSQVENARSEYLAGKITELIKAKGYGDSVQIEWEVGVAPQPAVLEPAFGFLCKRGFLAQSSDGSYRQTLNLWKDEIKRIRGHLEQLLAGFEALSESQRSNFPELVREYRRLLDVSKETCHELVIFNDSKVSKLILRRTEGEERHLDQHHPGPWITNMAKEYGRFLRETIPKLSEVFRVI